MYSSCNFSTRSAKHAPRSANSLGAAYVPATSGTRVQVSPELEKFRALIGLGPPAQRKTAPGRTRRGRGGGVKMSTEMLNQRLGIANKKTVNPHHTTAAQNRSGPPSAKWQPLSAAG